MLGKCLEAMGKKEDAKAAYGKVLAIQGDSASLAEQKAEAQKQKDALSSSWF